MIDCFVRRSRSGTFSRCGDVLRPAEERRRRRLRLPYPLTAVPGGGVIRPLEVVVARRGWLRGAPEVGKVVRALCCLVTQRVVVADVGIPGDERGRGCGCGRGRGCRLRPETTKVVEVVGAPRRRHREVVAEEGESRGGPRRRWGIGSV